MADPAILVTGGSGQVGGAVVRLAQARGIAVDAPSRATCDLSDSGRLTDALARGRWSMIIHCAAFTAVDRAESEPDTAYQVNAVAPELLALHAATHRIPLLHLSTDYVFDGSAEGWYGEDDPVSPLGVYGASKAAGEEAIRTLCPDHHAIIRTAWVLSAHGQNFLNTMVRLAGERDEVSVVDDQIGCPTSADDLAAAILDLAASGQISGQTWHAVNSGATSWHGLAEHIFARMVERDMRVPVLKAIPTSGYPTPARRPANSRLSTAKLVQTLGRALPDWQSAVDSLLEEKWP